MGVTTLSWRCTHWAQHCYLWGPHQPSPWPSLTAPQAPCPSPDQAQTAATPVTTTSSTSTCLHTRPLSGDTGGETLTITGRSISVRRTTPSKLSSSGTTRTTVTASTTSTTTTVAATRSLSITSQPTLPRHPPTLRAPNLRGHMSLLLGTLGTRDLFHILKSTTTWHDSTVKENHSSILFATDILHYVPLF